MIKSFLPQYQAISEKKYHPFDAIGIVTHATPTPLGTRLRVHMRTTLENGVLRNRQQVGRMNL